MVTIELLFRVWTAGLLSLLGIRVVLDGLQRQDMVIVTFGAVFWFMAWTVAAYRERSRG